MVQVETKATAGTDSALSLWSGARSQGAIFHAGADGVRSCAAVDRGINLQERAMPAPALSHPQDPFPFATDFLHSVTG